MTHPHTPEIPCPECEGTGRIEKYEHVTYAPASFIDCWKCHGWGRVTDEEETE